MAVDLLALNAYAAQEAEKLHEWAKGYTVGVVTGFSMGLLLVWVMRGPLG